MSLLDHFEEHSIKLIVKRNSNVALNSGESQKGEIKDGEFIPLDPDFPEDEELEFKVVPTGKQSLKRFPEGTIISNTKMFYRNAPQVAREQDVIVFKEEEYVIEAILDISKEEGFLKYYGLKK